MDVRVSERKPPVPGAEFVQRGRAFVKTVRAGSMGASHPDLIGRQPIKRHERILRSFWLERPRAEMWQLGPVGLLIVDPDRGADGLIFTFTTQEVASEQ